MNTAGIKESRLHRAGPGHRCRESKGSGLWLPAQAGAQECISGVLAKSKVLEHCELLFIGMMRTFYNLINMT